MIKIIAIIALTVIALAFSIFMEGFALADVYKPLSGGATNPQSLLALPVVPFIPFFVLYATTDKFFGEGTLDRLYCAIPMPNSVIGSCIFALISAIVGITLIALYFTPVIIVAKRICASAAEERERWRHEQAKTDADKEQ